MYARINPPSVQAESVCHARSRRESTVTYVTFSHRSAQRNGSETVAAAFLVNTILVSRPFLGKFLDQETAPFLVRNGRETGVAALLNRPLSVSSSPGFIRRRPALGHAIPATPRSPPAGPPRRGLPRSSGARSSSTPPVRSPSAPKLVSRTQTNTSLTCVSCKTPTTAVAYDMYSYSDSAWRSVWCMSVERGAPVDCALASARASAADGLGLGT